MVQLQMAWLRAKICIPVQNSSTIIQEMNKKCLRFLDLYDRHVVSACTIDHPFICVTPFMDILNQEYTVADRKPDHSSLVCQISMPYERLWCK